MAASSLNWQLSQFAVTRPYNPSCARSSTSSTSFGWKPKYPPISTWTSGCAAANSAVISSMRLISTPVKRKYGMMMIFRTQQETTLQSIREGGLGYPDKAAFRPSIRQLLPQHAGHFEKVTVGIRVTASPPKHKHGSFLIRYVYGSGRGSNGCRGSPSR